MTNPEFFLMAVQQCLTGGKSGGVHCTDVTNASRTMLFNIHSMDWDPELCKYDGILKNIANNKRCNLCKAALV